MITINSKIIEDELCRYDIKEINRALDYLNSFVNKINNLYVIEDDKKRKLNQLETFICIYDFVTNRNYNNDLTSQDIIRAINNDCFVCITFSKMIKVLCDEFNIPCIIKYSTVIEVGHANNEVIISDKKGNIHMLHVDATRDCLNHVAQSAKKYQNITRINGMLILEDDVNKYYKKQRYFDRMVQATFYRLVNDVRPQELFEMTEEDELLYDSFLEMIIDKIDYLSPSLIEICKYLNIDYKLNTYENIISTYSQLQQKYKQINNPIGFEELFESMRNAYMALLMNEK